MIYIKYYNNQFFYIIIMYVPNEVYQIIENDTNPDDIIIWSTWNKDGVFEGLLVKYPTKYIYNESKIISFYNSIIKFYISLLSYI
jgi:hypothetical protein